MLKKGTKLWSILNSKCPRCHEGEFFTQKVSFKLKKITEIHDNCPHCNLKYMIEPSFFYGAMYVSYALTVALAVAVFIISFLFLSFNLLESFVTITAVLILTTPIMLRLSRIIWINFFVKYDIKSTKNSH